MSALPPFTPFYAPISYGPAAIQPTNAVWVHRPPADTEGVSNDAWIEVTHCPEQQQIAPTNASSAREQSRHEKHVKLGQLMWLYVAPGSGVWINVGRTRVFRTYEEAWRFLSSAQWSRPDCARTEARRDAEVDGALSQIDSVQILTHQEYFSFETRSELVLVRWDNCQRLAHAGGGGPPTMCGAPPNLAPCAAAAEGNALGRINACTMWGTPFNGSVAAKVPLRSSRDPRSACAATQCYTDATRTEMRHYCPETAPGTEQLRS